MVTTYNANEYGFAQVKRGERQIKHTNNTTRDLLFRELVVVKDANNKCFIGFVAEVDGIAASGGVGMVDLMEFDVVSTEQIDTAQTFVKDTVQVWVDIQTNSAAAKLKQASAAGLYGPFNVLITDVVNGTGGRVEMRLPAQDGTIVIVS